MFCAGTHTQFALPRRQFGLASAGGHGANAPMAGKIVKVNVKAGQEVKKVSLRTRFFACMSLWANGRVHLFVRTCSWRLSMRLSCSPLPDLSSLRLTCVACVCSCVSRRAPRWW